MRKLALAALVAVLAMALVACGGGDDDSADVTTTTAGDDGGATTDDGDDDGATDAAVAAGLLDEDCAFLLSGAFLNPLAALTPGGDADLEDVNEQLEAIADEAPDEIKDAMATLSEGYAELAEVLKDVDLEDPQAFADPDVQEALADMEDVFDDDYAAAGETVSNYIAENCDPGS